MPHCNEEENYILNEARDKCIPTPGFHLPFAFLYVAIIWTIVILCRRKRDKPSKEALVSQLLIGYSAIFWAASICLTFLSLPMGYSFLTTMLLIGLAAGYFFNLASLVAFLMIIDDLPFKHWR